MQELKKKLNWKSMWMDGAFPQQDRSRADLIAMWFLFVTLIVSLLAILRYAPLLPSATNFVLITLLFASMILLTGAIALRELFYASARSVMKQEQFRLFIESYGTWIKPGPGHVWRWDEDSHAFVASDRVHVSQLGYPNRRGDVTKRVFFLGRENVLPVMIGNIWGEMCVYLHIDDPESLTSEQVGDIWTWYEELVKVAKWRTADVNESLRSVLTRIQEQCAKPICRDVERGDGYRKSAGARVRAEFPNASLLLDKDPERERAEQTGVRVGDLTEPTPSPAEHEELANVEPSPARLAHS